MHFLAPSWHASSAGQMLQKCLQGAFWQNETCLITDAP